MGLQILDLNEDVFLYDCIKRVGRRSVGVVQHPARFRRVFNITITYDTPPERIHRVVEILREILAVPEAPRFGNSDSVEAIEIAISRGAPPPLAAMIADIEWEFHPNLAISHPNPDFEPRVSFNEFNPDSLNIIVIYWYHPPDYWRYLDHATWINTQIVERFNAEAIDFAFPTQTLHLAGDEKRPLSVGQGASVKVDKRK
jgi:MscS family membrane protein